MIQCGIANVRSGSNLDGNFGSDSDLSSQLNKRPITGLADRDGNDREGRKSAFAMAKLHG